MMRVIGPLAVLAAGPLLVGGLPPAHVAEAILATLVAAGMLAPLGDVMRIAGRARSGSLVDAADRRRPWVVALATTLMLLMLRLPTRLEPATSPMTGALVVVIGAIVLVLLADLVALLRLRRLLADGRGLRSRTPESPPVDRVTNVLDFGVGDGDREELAPPRAVYRERERVVRLVRGSRRDAERVLRRSIVFDLAVLVPTLVLLGAACTANQIP
jgi:hypothetical protein